MNSVRRPTRWHLLTVSLLFFGYSGYYFCRSDDSVALSLILAKQVRKGTPCRSTLEAGKGVPRPQV